jgi:Flp pilus assembly pilin Flp
VRARRRRTTDPDLGATSVEYALLAGFIAAIAAGAFFGLGALVMSFFEQGNGAFP